MPANSHAGEIASTCMCFSLARSRSLSLCRSADICCIVRRCALAVAMPLPSTAPPPPAPTALLPPAPAPAPLLGDASGEAGLSHPSPVFLCDGELGGDRTWALGKGELKGDTDLLLLRCRGEGRFEAPRRDLVRCLDFSMARLCFKSLSNCWLKFPSSSGACSRRADGDPEPCPPDALHPRSFSFMTFSFSRAAFSWANLA